MRALEHMLTEGMFETGIRRIGAEQEMFLVDERWQPAPIVEQVLAKSTDDHLVSELNKFNLEFNLDPLVFQGKCLSHMEGQINTMLGGVRSLVEEMGAHVVLIGILPTIHLSDLSFDAITPNPRYYALNDAIFHLRGGPAEYQIRGIDELFVKHDSIALEGCNTSFQTHFQVDPEEFARLYNIAQAVAAPVLAAATNSPLLFGKRLWRETRIALFQQAVDTRSSNLYLREMSPRVHFGTKWVDDSVLEIFKEDISRFRVLLTSDDIEDPFEVLEEGGVPKLQALQLHNGTVYRWNRACYGIFDGKPHLRIENRILPSGPSPVDEVANAAFWFGLVSGIVGHYGDITTYLEFDSAVCNFIAASREGLGTQLVWVNGMRYPAHDLICEELLPLARDGLKASHIDADDVTRYLDIIEDRVTTRQTGSQWLLSSFAQTKGQGSRAERLDALVASTIARQQEGQPVSTWNLSSLDESNLAQRLQNTSIEQYMATDLFTVNEEELVDLVAYLMDWQRIRYVMVENEEHQLVGLISHRKILRYLADYGQSTVDKDVSVKEIMIKEPITVTPETKTLDAIQIMRERKIGSLPVVRDGLLLGLVTENEFKHIVNKLLDESLKEDIPA